MKYRKKPVEVDAYQWFIGMEDDSINMLPRPIKIGEMVFVATIRTLEDTQNSTHYVQEGDFIITGIVGEKYACKESIFHDTYELVPKKSGRKTSKGQ
jgi:hypothetical protein